MRRLLASKKAVTTTQIGLIAVVAIIAVAAGVYYAMLPPAETGVEQITIKWGMHWTDMFMQEWWMAQFAKYENAFNLANPDKNLTIEIVAAGGGELMTLLTTSFQAGESIDMFHVGISNAYVLQEAGAIEEPPAWLKADVLANFSDAGIGAVTIDGEIRGYPTEFGQSAVVLNEYCFDQAGLEMPPLTGYDNLTQWADAVRALTIWDGDEVVQYGYGTTQGLGTGSYFKHFLQSNGEKDIEDDLSEVNWNSPYGVQVLETYKALYDEGVLYVDTTSPWGGDLITAMTQDKVAMADGAAWWRLDLGYIRGEGDFDAGVEWVNDNCYVAAWPGSEQVIFAGSYIWAVNSLCANKDIAFDIAKFVNSPSTDLGGATPLGTFMGWAYGLGAHRKTDLTTVPYLSEPFVSRTIDLLQWGYIPQTFTEVNEVNAKLRVAIEAVFSGDSTAQEALDNAVAEANAILAAR
jgi:multiple sugar transport system substrate-binding protein